MPDTHVTVSLSDTALVIECACGTMYVMPPAAIGHDKYPGGKCAVCAEPLATDGQALVLAYKTLCNSTASVRMRVT
jgi:hypothetical protein